MLPCVFSKRRDRQAGQSMVETLVAATFILVPLFIMVPLLGKYIDMQASVLQAARNAAFERTIWSASGNRDGSPGVAKQTDAQIQAKIALRYFGALESPITSAAATASAYAPRDLWVDQSGNALLPKYSDITPTLNPSAASPDAADSTLSTALAGINIMMNGGTSLDFKGLFTGQVQASPVPVAFPHPFNTLALRFHSQDTLLANGWSAQSPTDVLRQTQNALPLGEKATLSGFAGSATDLSNLTPGQVLTNDPAEVPSDRLK